MRLRRGVRLGAPPGRLIRPAPVRTRRWIVYPPLMGVISLAPFVRSRQVARTGTGGGTGMSVELAALPAWLDDRAARGEFSGVVLLRRDGETVFEHAAGLASRAHGIPNTMSTRFAVASVAKWPLAVAVLRLVERGELDLHAPLVDLLPADQVPTAVTPQHTLHHILSMSSGLANYIDDDDETWAQFEGVIASLPGAAAGRPTSCRSCATCPRTGRRASRTSTRTRTSCSSGSCSRRSPGANGRRCSPTRCCGRSG